MSKFNFLFVITFVSKDRDVRYQCPSIEGNSVQLSILPIMVEKGIARPKLIFLLEYQYNTIHTHTHNDCNNNNNRKNKCTEYVQEHLNKLECHGKVNSTQIVKLMY